MSSDKSVLSENSPRTDNATRAVEKLSIYGFDEAHYYITTSREKFDVQKVFDLLGEKGKRECDALILQRNRETDYHVRVRIGVEKNEVHIHAMYLQEELNPHKQKSSDGGNEVGAEDFMEWLGKFFKHETSHIHLHLHYVYALASRQCKFPLPLKTTIEGDAEINGISLRLPKEPEGVSKVILQQGKSMWFIEVIANRRVRFKGFTLHNDVRAVASVVESLMEERKV